MGLFSEKDRQNGFTIVQVLAAVAIIAMIAAFAIPALISGMRRLELNSLDDSARSIFLAAQNTMTAMTGSGEFDDFVKNVAGGG